MSRSFIAALLCVVLLPALAFGAEGFGFYGIGGQLSYVSPEDIDGTIGLGAQADLGEFATGFVAYPSIAFWRTSEDYSDGYCEGEASFTEISFNADVRYYFLGVDTGTVRPFGGAGLALLYQMADWDVDCEGDFVDDSDSDSETDIAFNLIGGADFDVSESMTGFGELRFVMGGDYDVFKITGGVTFAMGGN
jgi:opacity protein-like surface antigen